MIRVEPDCVSTISRRAHFDRGADSGPAPSDVMAVLVCPVPGKHNPRGKMDEHNVSADSRHGLNQTPKVVDALRRGSPVSITTWGGHELSGTVCDREQTGILLDLREPDSNTEGYVFLPWSSIEQVMIREVSQRRVKFLPN